MGPTPCAPSSDRAPPRSAGPDGRAAPPCRDQTHRRTDLVRPPADPSCAAPADPCLKPTESRFASRLNESFATHSGGDLNRSTQHLLILLDKEVADGDVTDIVHGEAE